MLKRPESSLRRIALLCSRLFLRGISHLEQRVHDYLRHRVMLHQVYRPFSVMLFACMSVLLFCGDTCSDADFDYNLNEYLMIMAPLSKGNPPHQTQPTVKPRIAGTDGSQTGTASFVGNFTAITPAPQGVFLLQRQSDCSLNAITTTGPNASAASVATHYELTLHQLASLTTTADSFPNSCVDKNTGITSRSGIWVGKTQDGIQVFAAVGYFGGNTNTIQLINSNNGLTNTANTSLPYASLLATSDLNGDGNGDLVVVNGAAAPSAFVSVMLGNSNGTFQTAVSYPIAGDIGTAAVIEDVNGDGKLDIVAASNDQHLSVLLGNGDGTFTAGQTFSVAVTGTVLNSLITADVNNDGKKDIVCSNGMVLLGNGDGTFTPVSTVAFPPTQNLSSGEPLGMASGDVNKDGKPDLVVSTGVIVYIYLGNGDGTFTPGQHYASINNSGYVTVTDLDGDGNPDIYTGLANGGVYGGDDANNLEFYALMGNGNGTFQGAGSVPTGRYTGNNLGDVNGDGQMDLITQNSSNTNVSFTVSLGNPKGSFTPTSTITPPTSFVLGGTTFSGVGSVGSYAVADVNGDGKADLVVVEYNVPQINPYTNQTQINAGGIYFVALSNGDGTFKTPVPNTLPQIAPGSGFDISLAVGGLQIADFNKDGKRDLVYVYDETGYGTAQSYNRGMAVVLGNGDGTFATSNILTSTYASNTAPNTALLPQVVNTSDLNGDGKADMLVVSNTFSTSTGAASALQAYIGNGDGTFQAPGTLPFAANVYGIPAVIDVNKDGKLDVVSLMETSGSQAEMGIALGNGDGTFGTPTVLNLSGGDSIQSGSLAAADFNGDGNVDLALLDYSSYGGVFYGNGAGTFTSVPISGGVVPKDLLNLYVGGAGAIAVDLNKDGKPDILVGGTILLSLYGSAPAVTSTQASTTIAVSSSPSGSVAAGTSVTFTATITPGASSSTPSGTVTFLDGGTTLGTGTVSSNVATYSTSTLVAGNHNITAVYGGDTNFTGSTSSVLSVIVTAPVISTTTALSASATSAVSGTSLTFTAQVTPASGTIIPTGSITFTDGNTSLSVVSLDNTGKATYTTSALAVGSHTIKAAYGGAAAFGASTSSNVGVTITAAPVPDFAISVSPTSSTVTHGNSITTTVSITPANGFNQATALTCSGVPTGGTCAIVPTSVVPSGTAASTATVTLQTSASSSSLANVHRNFELAATLPLGLIGTTSLLGLGLGRRRRWPLLVTALVAFTALAAVTGCGHSSPPASTTFTPITATLTLTGTSGSLTHSTTWTVTVQ